MSAGTTVNPRRDDVTVAPAQGKKRRLADPVPSEGDDVTMSDKGTGDGAGDESVPSTGEPEFKRAKSIITPERRAVLLAEFKIASVQRFWQGLPELIRKHDEAFRKRELRIERLEKRAGRDPTHTNCRHLTGEEEHALKVFGAKVSEFILGNASALLGGKQKPPRDLKIGIVALIDALWRFGSGQSIFWRRALSASPEGLAAKLINIRILAHSRKAIQAAVDAPRSLHSEGCLTDGDVLRLTSLLSKIDEDPELRFSTTTPGTVRASAGLRMRLKSRLPMARDSCGHGCCVLHSVATDKDSAVKRAGTGTGTKALPGTVSHAYTATSTQRKKATVPPALKKLVLETRSELAKHGKPHTAAKIVAELGETYDTTSLSVREVKQMIPRKR
jgi:hypothetical protein